MHPAYGGFWVARRRPGGRGSFVQGSPGSSPEACPLIFSFLACCRTFPCGVASTRRQKMPASPECGESDGCGSCFPQAGPRKIHKNATWCTKRATSLTLASDGSMGLANRARRSAGAEWEVRTPVRRPFPRRIWPRIRRVPRSGYKFSFLRIQGPGSPVVQPWEPSGSRGIKCSFSEPCAQAGKTAARPPRIRWEKPQPCTLNAI
jgi:hypothetical protein